MSLSKVKEFYAKKEFDLPFWPPFAKNLRLNNIKKIKFKNNIFYNIFFFKPKKKC